GGEVRVLDGKRGGTQGIMHHKFVLFDRERVVTGSFNLTAGAEHVNYENALLTANTGVGGGQEETSTQKEKGLRPCYNQACSPDRSRKRTLHNPQRGTI